MNRDWTKDFEDDIIFETLVGSHIYGTNTTLSDTDYRGVVIPPRYVREGMLQNFEQKDGWAEPQYKTFPKERVEDRVVYALKKFMKLCMEANPAIIELLFVPERFWVRPKRLYFQVDPWTMILENRESFLSKKAKYTFTGYAHSQLSRIKRHRVWLLDPPKVEPTREGYGLPPNPLLSSEQYSAMLTISAYVLGAEWQEEARREKAYHEARMYWNMYADWKKTRNPKRAELEAKYGYDTKHASHLVRLCYEGEELLMTGKITLPRPEIDELRAVIEGFYNYDQLIERFERFDEKFEVMYDESKLPHSPDLKKVNDLYLKIISQWDEHVQQKL